MVISLQCYRARRWQFALCVLALAVMTAPTVRAEETANIPSTEQSRPEFQSADVSIWQRPTPSEMRSVLGGAATEQTPTRRSETTKALPALPSSRADQASTESGRTRTIVRHPNGSYTLSCAKFNVKYASVSGSLACRSGMIV